MMLFRINCSNKTLRAPPLNNSILLRMCCARHLRMWGWPYTPAGELPSPNQPAGFSYSVDAPLSAAARAPVEPGSFRVGCSFGCSWDPSDRIAPIPAVPRRDVPSPGSGSAAPVVEPAHSGSSSFACPSRASRLAAGQRRSARMHMPGRLWQRLSQFSGGSGETSVYLSAMLRQYMRAVRETNRR